MAVSVNNPADLVNYALRLIGFKLRVGNLFDGSAAGSAALDIYGQTRDEIMRQDDFDFARRSVALTLLKTAPDNYIPPTTWSVAYPPLPWKYEYDYPADALVVKSVVKTPLFLLNIDPTPQLFDDLNDVYNGAQQRVIVANIPDAVCHYTARITDPTQWDVTFTEAFAAAVGRRLVPLLGNAQLLQAMAAEEAQALATAEREND